MFEKLRKLFGGGSGSSPVQTGRVRTGLNPSRRPARPRSLGSASGKLSARVQSGGGPLVEPRPEVVEAEIACPNCGEPMLPGWGTTCGKCRPNLVAAKTMFLAKGQIQLPVHAAGGLTFGWLAVIRSVDERQRGKLIELDRDRVVLSRAGAAPTGPVLVVQFVDSFMSSAHAVIGRPATGDRSDAFTIHDRENPGPSANGTFVNSQKLGPHEAVRLGDGDVIKVGATELLFKSLWLPPVGARTPGVRTP